MQSRTRNTQETNKRQTNDNTHTHTRMPQEGKYLTKPVGHKGLHAKMIQMLFRVHSLRARVECVKKNLVHVGKIGVPLNEEIQGWIFRIKQMNGAQVWHFVITQDVSWLPASAAPVYTIGELDVSG